MAMECTDKSCTFHDKDEPFCHEKECWKKTLNLCDTCKKNIASCDGVPEFGTGKENDNVYACCEHVYVMEDMVAFKPKNNGRKPAVLNENYDWDYDIEDPNSWLETGEPSTYTFLSEENKHEHRRKVLFEKARAVKEFTLFVIAVPVITIFAVVICVVPWLLLELLDFMERMRWRICSLFCGTKR
jgi:hypothetical protein